MLYSTNCSVRNKKFLFSLFLSDTLKNENNKLVLMKSKWKSFVFFSCYFENLYLTKFISKNVQILSFILAIKTWLSKVEKKN